VQSGFHPLLQSLTNLILPTDDRSVNCNIIAKQVPWHAMLSPSLRSERTRA
jgi:hypothetical protein